jgi:hypothetical protein
MDLEGGGHDLSAVLFRHLLRCPEEKYENTTGVPGARLEHRTTQIGVEKVADMPT